MTARELLAQARERLTAAAFSPSPREALLLLSRVLGLSEAQLLTRPDEVVAPEESARFRSLLERRLSGEPVAYLLGEKEFYGRSFFVDSRVLIPRPETEHLVEAVVGLTLPTRPRILDLGTGSGCLAVTMALELAEARVVAIDASLGALAVAAVNCRRYALESRVLLAGSRWTEALRSGAFDLVVCNPPYIDPATAGDLSPEILDHEPHEALFAVCEGTASYIELLTAPIELRPQARLALEIGAGQRPRIEELARQGLWQVEQVVPDYGGHPRVVILRRGERP